MRVSDIYREQFSFSQQEIVAFCDLVGDINPIHRDVNFAKEQGYENCIVQGIFAIAVFSARASRLMPLFINAIECSRETQFIRPVLLNETVSLTCEIIELDLSKKIAIVREMLKNGKGQICIDSIVKTKILE